MNSISNYLFGFSGYFTGNSSQEEKAQLLKETELLNAAERGESSIEQTIAKQDPAGTVRVPSSVVANSDRTRMIDQDPEARAAAGDASKFVARFKSLLSDQYKDKDAKTRVVIGTAIYNILAKAEPKNGVASIIDPKTAADVGLLADAGGKTAISAMNKTLTKMGNAALQLALTRPTADLDVVLGYQQIIRTLLENESVFESLRDELTKTAGDGVSKFFATPSGSAFLHRMVVAIMYNNKCGASGNCY